MSKLRITHQTTYSYSVPVQLGQHRLVLRPRESHDVRLLDMQLTISPVAHRIWWRVDVFGNAIATVDFMQPTRELRIVNQVVLDREPRQAAHTVVPDEPLPVSYDPVEAPVVQAFAALSFPHDRDAVLGWLQNAMKLPGELSALAALNAMNRTLFEGFSYQRREERGVQGPAETLAKSSGSCRDKATLLMEGARCLGMAARFVSGYLDCAASHAGRASTHAWMEAYLPHTGWVGFDPTIGELSSRKHIPVGVSSHPRGVMPISGRFTGSYSDFSAMTVQVKMESLPPTDQE